MPRKEDYQSTACGQERGETKKKPERQQGDMFFPQQPLRMEREGQITWVHTRNIVESNVAGKNAGNPN